MCRSYFFKVAALSCQNPLQAAPEPGTGNFHLRSFTMVGEYQFFSYQHDHLQGLGDPIFEGVGHQKRSERDYGCLCCLGAQDQVQGGRQEDQGPGLHRLGAGDD